MSRKMNLYYYISKIEHSSFHELQGKIHQEYEITNYEGDKVKSYKNIETFKCHISKDQESYETVSFKIDFGKDSCCNHWADNLKDFKTDFAKKQFGDWEPASRKEYEKLRKELFDVYQSKMFLDIDTVKTVQDFSVRSLTK